MRPGSFDIFTFIAEAAEQLAHPGRASWIAVGDNGDHGDTPSNGGAVLQYVHSHRDIADALERGQHVSICEDADLSTPTWVFPLHNGHHLVRLLSLTFPPRARTPRTVISRVKRLCEAAAPLLAEEKDRAHEPENKSMTLPDAHRQLAAHRQVLSHTLRNSVHDLQTPLVALLGYSRLMLREEVGPLTAAQRDYLGTILENMSRMTRELKALLELAKAEPLRFACFDLDGVAAGVLGHIRAGAGARRVRIENRFSERPFQVVGDAAMISETLDSVIGYVIRQTAEGGLVTVGFERGEEIVVRTATGHVKRFEDGTHNAASPQQPDELAAAGRAVRLHGGGVPVCRSTGKGLIVTFTLPIISWKEPFDQEDVREQAFSSCG